MLMNRFLRMAMLALVALPITACAPPPRPAYFVPPPPPPPPAVYVEQPPPPPPMYGGPPPRRWLPVRHWAGPPCPRGYHLGPEGGRCWMN
jgi:hypothetical protein